LRLYLIEQSIQQSFTSDNKNAQLQYKMSKTSIMNMNNKLLQIN
jgi:hypothetical protein